MTTTPYISESPPPAPIATVRGLSLAQLLLLVALTLIGLGLIGGTAMVWHQWTAAHPAAATTPTPAPAPAQGFGTPRGFPRAATPAPPPTIERPPANLAWGMFTMGTAAALCFAGVMALLNRLRTIERFTRWHTRVPISILKRVLLLLQIAAMGAALYGVGVHYMTLKIYPL